MNKILLSVLCILLLSPSLLFSAQRITSKDVLDTEIRKSIPKNAVLHLFVENYETGDFLAVNADSKVEAASLIKIHFMFEVYREIFNKTVSAKEKLAIKRENQLGWFRGFTQSETAVGVKYTVEQLVNMMITQSDNIAFNTLVDRIGKDNFNESMRMFGFPSTYLHQKIGLRKPELNTTSARDLGRVLKMIYCDEIVTPEYCKKMRKILEGQTFTGRIIKLFPKRVKIGHKTGTSKWTVSEAGVINGKYSISIIILTTESVYRPSVRYKLEKTISKISRLIYDYFNNK